MGTIKRLTVGISWNGYRRSLDVCMLSVGKEADYKMKQLRESEDK